MPDLQLRKDCELLIAWCKDEKDLQRVGGVVKREVKDESDIQYLRAVWKRKQKGLQDESRKRSGQ